MTGEILMVLGLGFILGIRHTFDPDHIVAVSTVAARSRNVFQSAKVGVYWGVGHTLTLLVIGGLLFSLQTTIPDRVEQSLEFIVGIMLVFLGITSFIYFKKRYRRVFLTASGQTLANEYTPGMKSMWIGMIHGLAGSGAMILLTMTTSQTLLQALFYLLIFGVGTIFGMVLFALLFSLPFLYFTKKAEAITGRLGMIIAIVSILFGLYFMYEIAFVEGLLFSLVEY